MISYTHAESAKQIGGPPGPVARIFRRRSRCFASRRSCASTTPRARSRPVVVDGERRRVSVGVWRERGGCFREEAILLTVVIRTGAERAEPERIATLCTVSCLSIAKLRVKASACLRARNRTFRCRCADEQRCERSIAPSGRMCYRFGVSFLSRRLARSVGRKDDILVGDLFV